MNKFVYFMAVGLAFTVLQVATVEAVVDCADPTNATMPECTDASSGGPIDTTGGTVPMCGDVPCPTGTTESDMANQMEENPPGSGDSVAGGPPTLTLEDPRCQLAPADRDPGCPAMAGGAGHPGHAGMAPGTTAMCGDVPCTTAGGTSDGAGAPDCAALPTPAEVAACWQSNTAGGAGGCADEETPALVAACVANQTAAGS